MMNPPAQRSRKNPRRKAQAKRPAALDVWKTPEPLPEVRPVVVPDEVGALLRSLGDPPVTGAIAVGHYFSNVIERAAAVAVAIALSADLLDEPEFD
jgi:hypothetical protein